MELCASLTNYNIYDADRWSFYSKMVFTFLQIASLQLDLTLSFKAREIHSLAMTATPGILYSKNLVTLIHVPVISWFCNAVGMWYTLATAASAWGRGIKRGKLWLQALLKSCLFIHVSICIFNNHNLAYFDLFLPPIEPVIECKDSVYCV